LTTAGCLKFLGLEPRRAEMTADLRAFAWPLARLDEAVDVLARRTGHQGPAPAASMALSHTNLDDPHAVGRAIERLLSAHGLEVEPYAVRYRDAVRLPAPLVLRLPGHPAFLVVLQRQRGRYVVAGPDRRLHRISRHQLADALRGPVTADRVADVDRLLAAASVPQSRQAKVRDALLVEQLGHLRVADAWRIAPEPGASFAGQLRRAGIGRSLIALTSLHAAQFALWILSWWLVGRGALLGHLDWGWLTAWVLLLATIVPLQLWTTWIQGWLALGVGQLLKQRLLTGALRLDPEEIRHQGVGQLLGRVLESEAVESLVLNGGLQAGLAIVELLFCAGILWLGSAGTAHVLLLALWTAGGIGAAAIYLRRRRHWSEWRLAMTHELVERIAGHRTRLAQERRERWHDAEDRTLEEYIARASQLDRLTPALLVAMPRGWITVAIAVLAPAFVSGATTPDRLAVSFGGILVASLALRRLADGLSQLAGAAIAWEQARPLFEAASRRPAESAAIADAPPGPGGTVSSALDARDVTFRYPTRAEPVLRGCTLRAADRDRILIQGPSGGGKSTFASMVAGLRTPDSGLVLVDGLDRRTIGPHGWRRRVVAAPQFHENHVLTETFAFNLLMGRRWPPSEEDMQDAAEACRALGLGDLLERMPAGLLQLVGESGWQLSHGERSRLFLARALLQGGDVMILDESFAALDPENLRQTLGCVLDRAPTLLVIAHP
jgi:ATP-binding cassette subfamily B protein